MSSKAFDATDLRLYGEHINLNSRREDDGRRNGSPGRPRSALYTSNINSPDSRRRPFSAGNYPNSLPIQPFIKKINERREFIGKSTDFLGRSYSIPGAADSITLFNKLVRDPIVNSKQNQKHKLSKNMLEFSSSKHYTRTCDNLSDVSSVDTVTSFGTKIKNKAQISKKLVEERTIERIEGSPLKLLKPKPIRFADFDMKINDFDSENKNEAKSIEDSEPKNSLKLSIYVPNNNKDENTSSGVSSSSDIQPLATSSPVAGRPTIHKFVRTKKNIAINWFPENTPRSNVEAIDIETSDHADLKGIVSFSDGKFGEKIVNYDDDEDDDCPPESARLYNTELSLVEEESSQDSDTSPKMSSSIFDRYTDYDDPTNNIRLYSSLTKQELIKPDVDKIESSSLNLYNSNKPILRNRYVGEKNTKEKTPVYEFVRSKTSFDKEDEMEIRFKEIEEKYRAIQRGDDKIKSLENKYDVEGNNGMKRAWTSLENVVSKENDPVCLTSEMKKYDEYKQVQFDKKDPTPTPRKNYALESLKPIEYSAETLPQLKIDTKSIITARSSSEDKGIEYVKDIPDIIINFTNGTTQINSNNNTSIVHDVINIESDKIYDKPNDATVVQENDGTVEEYPDYLQTSEVKQYTSKVIEDYKREIATIDTAHELTLRDIRSGYSERFDVKNYNKDTPDQDDDETTGAINNYQKLSTTPISVRLENQDTLNRDISSFIDEYKNYTLGGYKEPTEIKLNKCESDPEITDTTKYVTSSTLKTKKKIKKKDRGGVARRKSFSGNESGDSGLKKKGKTESKRLAKSATCKKDGNNRVRFKSQKIAMSKSSTNVRNTNFIDKDNEIISWMATKISTSDETSSNDVHDTPTPDLIKEKSLEYKMSSSPKIIDLEAEQRIEPIIKEKQGAVANFVTLNKENDKSTDLMVKRDFAKERNKAKEVTFEMNKYTFQGGDDFSLQDWVGNDTDGNELSDLLDDDTMVSNIYSVLKEIEQTGSSVTVGGGDSIESKGTVSAMDESKSAEYRDILSYLDKVENTANDDITSLSHTQPPFSLKVEELMELSKGELAHRAVASALAAGKAGAAAARLRVALTNAANRATARIKAERLAARQKANASSQQSAQTVARHQKFIEQLINEKKALAERIEKLVAAVETSEARNARAAKASAERLQLELKNQRQRLSQAHQREKQTWLKQHTQKIKDMTIKGLEGEIREMEDKHSEKLVMVQREWERKMLEDKEIHTKEVRVLKESSARYLEDELDKERFLAAERMEQKRMEWESALATAAERAGAEARETARGARKEAEQWKRDKEKELEERRRQIEEQAEQKRSELMVEAAQMKNKLTKDFEKYKEDNKKKQAEIMRDKEMEIRSITRRERDREIERAIESMEAEAEEGRKEMQESIRRIKDKYESDMKILEDAEHSALQRCKEARELLRESQELCAQHQITITQLEGRLRQAEELRVQMVAEMEISLRTVEIKSREEIEEARAQMMNLQLQHKDEMHQLYAKVKVAVSKKDDALTAARRDATMLRDRCLRLEARLAT